MAAIKAVDRIAEKWARVTPQRTQDYTDGIESPRRDWLAATTAAADVYKEAVTKAANTGQYAHGVRQAGTQKWQSRARSKGPQRFAEGVQIAQPDYAAGFAPYAQVIAGTTLPPRFPKGDPRNLERVKVISQALARKRSGATT